MLCWLTLMIGVMAACLAAPPSGSGWTMRVCHLCLTRFSTLANFSEQPVGTISEICPRVWKVIAPSGNVGNHHEGFPTNNRVPMSPRRKHVILPIGQMGLSLHKW